MNSKELDLNYERLVKLYLRLKGYIVSNLIIHSPTKGVESGEIDIIGIRFPFHRQDDRKVICKDLLECSADRIEIIIAEVKNVNKLHSVKFNKGIRSSKENIEKLIKWIGCFNEIDDTLISEFEKHLNSHQHNDLKGFSHFFYENEIGNFLVKFVFFCPSLEPFEKEGIKYITGTELLDFTWQCLNKANIVDTCSRSYNYELWNELEDLVRFFKDESQIITKKTFEDWANREKKQIDN